MKYLPLLAALAFVPAAHAERETVTQSVVIGEITDTESAERALGALYVAAQRACGDADHLARRHLKRDHDRCVSEAVADGVAQIDDPLLTAAAQREG